jgi:hypothetical protein
MTKQHIVKHAPILREKLDATRRTVTCMLIAADTPDLHGDIMRPAAITAALDSYMDASQVVGRMHTEPTASIPRRVWQDSAGNAWTETYVADAADWQAIADGAYTGLSWAGFAYRSALPDGNWLLTEPEMLEYSFVDKPAVPAAVFKHEDGPGADDGEEPWDPAREPGSSLAMQLAVGSVPRRVQPPPAGVQCNLVAADQERVPKAAAEDIVDPQQDQEQDQEPDEAPAASALDPLAALVAQITEAVAQTFALLLQRNAELGKQAAPARRQPGASQRLSGIGGSVAAPAVEEVRPAWLR